MEQIKKKKGGAMPGAGRKKLTREKCKVYTFCVWPSHEKKVRAFIAEIKESHGYERHQKKSEKILNK